MAMSGEILAVAIKEAIKLKPGYDKFDDGAMGDIIDVIANEVVNHIQTLAIVNTTVAVASVSGVTSGVSVSGPGAGTGTGSIL